MPIVGARELGRELATTLNQIISQIEEIKQDGKDRGITPSKMRDAHGNYVLVPLLAAKAQTLHAITLLNQR